MPNQPSTQNPPAPAATPAQNPAPAATPAPAKSEPKFTVAGFATDFVKAVSAGTPAPAAVDSLSLAFIGLGGQRKNAIGESLQQLFSADQATRDRATTLLATLNERLTAASGSKRTAPAVPPATRYATAIMALHSAIGAIELPEGLDQAEADKMVKSLFAGSFTAPEGIDQDKLDGAVKRAVAAVSRGGSINRGETKARKTGTGTAKDHVAEAVKSVKVGETVTVDQISKFHSTVWANGGISVGHVRDTLAKKDGTLRSGDTWTAVAGSDGKVTGAKRTK